MGYGFVKLKSEADCMSVIKTLQGNAFLKNPSAIKGMFQEWNWTDIELK